MNKSILYLFLGWVAILVWGGLGGTVMAGQLHGEDGSPLWVVQGQQPQQLFQSSQPFRLQARNMLRVGIRWDGSHTLEWQARFRNPGQAWSVWFSAKTTWQEGVAHNSHIDPPQGVAQEIDIRLQGEGHLTFAAIELLQTLGPWAVGKTSAPQGWFSSAPSPLGGILEITGPYNPRSTWNAVAAKCTTKDATKTRIAIHHTVTPNNDSVSPEARLQQIQSYHQNTQGWCDIGYHILISQDGRAWEGRPADTLGSNVSNNNTQTLGISFMGTFTTDTPNSKMLCTGAKLIDWAVKTFGIKRDRSVIMGHRQFPSNSTSCPGDKLYAEISNMIAQSSQSGNCTTAPPPKCDNIKTANLGGSTLNIRQSATSQSNKLGEIPEGTCLKVAAKNDSGQNISGNSTWYQITYNNITGWISGYYTECSTCVPPPGTVKGIVYDSKAGKTKPLSGVVLQWKQGASVTTKTDGSYSFSVEDGTHTLTLTKTGYKTKNQTAQVDSGKTLTLDIALDPQDTQPPKDEEAPVIQITTPQDGSQTTQVNVRVEGSVSDNDKVARVALNGKDIKIDAQGKFAETVVLQPGPQRIQVDAWDTTGNQGTAEVTITYVVSGEGTVVTETGTTEPIASQETSTNESTTEIGTVQETASSDAGTQTDQPNSSATDTSSSSDDRPIVLDDTVATPCLKLTDCKTGQVCDQGKCVAADSGDLSQRLQGGCGCQGSPLAETGWFWLGLLLLGFWICRKRGQIA